MSTLAVGLMSGTSLDGIDAALVRIPAADQIELVAFRTTPFAPDQRQRILTTIASGTARHLAGLDFELGEWFADATAALLAETNTAANAIALIASHGQTVWHDPGQATLQLGNPAVIAERVGVRVVSDFRSRDIAAGGQGAPLIPKADAVLFGHASRGRGFLNLGGMSNVTWVPRRGAVNGIVAFDAGPGNAVIDAVVRRLIPGASMDAGGQLASTGTPIDSVVSDALTAEYFGRPPPKSTGRELFGERFADQLLSSMEHASPQASTDDRVATAVAIVANSISNALRAWVPSSDRELVVSGGGRRNHTLMQQLRRGLADWEIRLFDECFFDGDAKEAAAFAYLGWLTLESRSGNVPAATGARRERVLGRITPA